MSFTAFSQPFKSPFEIARQNAFIFFFLLVDRSPAALLASPESPVEREDRPGSESLVPEVAEPLMRDEKSGIFTNKKVQVVGRSHAGQSPLAFLANGH
jgi:hypothetical protein